MIIVQKSQNENNRTVNKITVLEKFSDLSWK